MSIEINDIQKSYGKKTVLRNISFQAHPGSCIAILGQNGCGKSTLLSILAGIQKADKGSFIWQGSDLLKDKKKRTEVVGYVPQGTPLLNELTARDNLQLWYSCAGRDMKKDLETGVPALLGISDFINVPVNKMSGGMKKRLSIACAVAHHPKILLLDESSAALDLVCKGKIYEYFRRFLHNGGIILMATHEVQELSLCNEYKIIKDGIIYPYEYKGDIQALTKELQEEN